MTIYVTIHLSLIFAKIYTYSMEKDSNKKSETTHRKAIRKEHRLTIRFTEPLYKEIETRAYEENKTVSGFIIQAMIKFLNFKMPPRDKA